MLDERVVFEAVTPVIPVSDLAVALARYRRLGFAVRAYGHGTGYGYADRGRVSLHLNEWDGTIPDEPGQWSTSTSRTPTLFVQSGWPREWRDASGRPGTRIMA